MTIVNSQLSVVHPSSVPAVCQYSGLPPKLTLNDLALIGKPEKARKIKGNQLFHLHFLAKYGIIREEQLTLEC